MKVGDLVRYDYPGLGQAWDFDLLSKEDTPEVLAKKEALGLAGINVFQLKEGLLY